MSKRFTDTGLNREPWFRKLSPKLKCATRFLFDECDTAGIWVIDMETMSYFVGEEVTISELFAGINSDKSDRIEKYKSNKIFIPGFVDFQYGHLTENCKPHRPIIEKLKKYGLYERVLKGYQNTIETLEEKEKDKEEEKDQDFGKPENLLPQNQQPIVHAMKDQWFVINPTYPFDKVSDMIALFSIGNFFAGPLKQKWVPETDVGYRTFCETWKEVATWISKDSFYSGLSLTAISKTSTLQTIWQKSKQKNGTHQQSPTSRNKRNNGAYAALEDLKADLARGDAAGG